MNLFVIISVLAVVSVDMTFSRRLPKKKMRCLSGDGSSYRGIVDETSSGRKCLYWNLVRHPWGNQAGVGNHNYCRNPDQSLMPWCYVRRGRWAVSELCHVPACSQPTEKPTVRPTVKPTSKPYPLVDTERTCGELSERRMNKIVGGFLTAIESHPWTAAIFYKRNKFLCGGSLISPCWVLSAAHCFRNEDGDLNVKGLSVFLGKTDISETDAAREQKFTVEKMIIHQDFDSDNFNSDIALLKIRNTNGGCAVKTPSARTVCLPPALTQLPSGFTCSIAGYGKEQEGAWEYSKRLKKTDVKLLSNTDCNRKLYYDNRINENMLCAASPDWSTDACHGDSGGPLVCEASGRMFLFGVVSWGEGCAKKNKPGVYTQVTNYNSWIAEKTGLTAYTTGLMYPQK
ncbi:plasminogen activator, urokinase a [Menidia menidia]